MKKNHWATLEMLVDSSSNHHIPLVVTVPDMLRSLWSHLRHPANIVSTTGAEPLASLKYGCLGKRQ